MQQQQVLQEPLRWLNDAVPDFTFFPSLTKIVQNDYLF
jgi:hypothetical protein